MKTVYTVCLLFALSAPAWSQDEPVPDTPVIADSGDVFPSELILLPEEVQTAASEGLEAETAPVPSGLNAADEAYYRAQIAYVGENWVSARQYAETAAVAGHVEAAMLAGLIARDGRTGAPDFAAASRWFQRAAEQEEAVALYQLGLLAAMGDESLDLGQPRRWFERAARAGHVRGMVSYALSLRASPIPQDHVTARQWAERAAQFGSAEGMYQYAQILDEGVGGDADPSGARLWFERAADSRHAEAAFQAGMMWAEGEGGTADDAEALDWLRISAESGYAPAQGQYGLMLYQGRGGAADVEMAAYWFSQGALGGDPESQFLYAFVLARGEGVPQDYVESYRWTLLAAEDDLGAPVFNPSRDQLQAGLERGLPPDVQQRVRAEMRAAD